MIMISGMKCNIEELLKMRKRKYRAGAAESAICLALTGVVPARAEGTTRLALSLRIFPPRRRRECHPACIAVALREEDNTCGRKRGYW